MALQDAGKISWVQGSWQCAEVMARGDRGKRWSWKFLGYQHNGFPSRDGTSLGSFFFAAGSNLLAGDLTVKGNKGKGIVRLKQ